MADRLTQRTAGQIQSRREQLLWDDRMAGSARGSVAVSPPSTRQQQRGNIETCLMLNKKGSRKCRRIDVRSKETSTDPLKCSLALVVRLKRGAHSRAASGRQPPMDWRGRSIRKTAIASRPFNQSAGNSQLPAWRPGEAHRSRRPAARVAEKRRLGRPVVRG